MTKKFILLDQTIKGNGGHHLEYAKRVLKAAKSMGYTTVLGVHKECEDIDCPDIDIFEKIFSHTVWDNLICEKQIIKAPGVSLLKEFIEGKDRFIFVFMYAQLRYGYRLLSGTRAYLTTQFYRSRTSSSDSMARPTLFGRIQVQFTRWAIGKSNTRSGKISYLKPILQLLKFAGAFALLPVVAMLVLVRWRSSSMRYHNFAEAFAKECADFFSRLDVKESDQVFIPTLGDLELIGVALCCQERNLAGLRWYLLFRSDLFNIRELGHVSHNNETSRTRAIHAEFKQRCRGSHVYFYTDTELLTELYDRLGVFKFETLPIPLDESLGRTSIAASPLVVSYIGDIREEKGFHHLPDLIRSVRTAGLDHNKVVFKFQSNFPAARLPSSVRRAKTELLASTDSGVELLGGPFDSAQYLDLINSSDIILALYDAEQYYARSSGIFAESIAAGVPAVYPLKSWMGAALAQTEQAYFDELEQRCPHSEWISALDQYLVVSEGEGVPVVFFRYRGGVAYSSRFVRLILQPQHQSESCARNICNVQPVISVLLDMRLDHGIRFIQDIPTGSYRIEMIAERLGSERDSGSHPPIIDLDYRISVLPSRVPTQSVSAGFDSVENIGTALVELITHYHSYASHCEKFADSWRATHSASGLVRHLEESRN